MPSARMGTIHWRLWPPRMRYVSRDTESLRKAKAVAKALTMDSLGYVATPHFKAEAKGWILPHSSYPPFTSVMNEPHVHGQSRRPPPK